MLRPAGATAFKKCCWSEGASWVDLMITAIWIVVCQNLPMDMREEILTNEVLEGSSMSTGSNTSFDIERTSTEKVSPGLTEKFQEARVLVSTMVVAVCCCPTALLRISHDIRQFPFPVASQICARRVVPDRT